jgi:hypothetical protein
VTLDREHKKVLTADAIFELWHTCAFYQTEAALEFERVITEGDPRHPAPDEVRGFIHGVVNGALLPPPPPKRPWWRKVIIYLTQWES